MRGGRSLSRGVLGRSGVGSSRPRGVSSGDKRKARALVVTKHTPLVSYSKHRSDSRLGHPINGAPTIRVDCSMDALARARGCEEFEAVALLRYLDTEQIIAMKGNGSAPWIEANIRMTAGRRVAPISIKIACRPKRFPNRKTDHVRPFSTASTLTGSSSLACDLFRIHRAYSAAPEGRSRAGGSRHGCRSKRALRIC